MIKEQSDVNALHCHQTFEKKSWCQLYFILLRFIAQESRRMTATVAKFNPFPGLKCIFIAVKRSLAAVLILTVDVMKKLKNLTACRNAH